MSNNREVNSGQEIATIMDELECCCQGILRNIENGLMMYAYGNPQGEGDNSFSLAQEQLALLQTNFDALQQAVKS